MAKYTRMRLGKGVEGKFYLYKKGVSELLNSSEMRDVIEKYASEKVATAGPGYAYEVRTHDIGGKRLAANLYPETYEARQDNYENNTLLKVIGS